MRHHFSQRTNLIRKKKCLWEIVRLAEKSNFNGFEKPFAMKVSPLT